jgi:hypothetical protein
MSLFRDKPFNDFIFLHTSDGFVFPLMVDMNIFHESFLLFFIRYLLLALSLLSSIKFSGVLFFLKFISALFFWITLLLFYRSTRALWVFLFD